MCFFDKSPFRNDKSRESQRSLLWTNSTGTSVASATTFMTLNMGIRKPVKMPCRGLRSRNCPITGFALTAEQRKKILRIWDNFYPYTSFK